MTKKHFEAIAKLIKENTNLEDHNPANTFIDKQNFVAFLSDYFQKQNANFQVDRFLMACEAPEDTESCIKCGKAGGFADSICSTCAKERGLND